MLLMERANVRESFVDKNKPKVSENQKNPKIFSDAKLSNEQH